MKTLQEMADIFRVSYRTILNWKKDGLFETIEIKGIILVTEEEIERIINLHTIRRIDVAKENING